MRRAIVRVAYGDCAVQIVYLEDIKAKKRMSANGHDPVPPKMETHAHGRHRYTLRFEPSEIPAHRWTWCVSYTRVYQYYGSAPTIERAARDARRRIDELTKREEQLA